MQQLSLVLLVILGVFAATEMPSPAQTVETTTVTGTSPDTTTTVVTTPTGSAATQAAVSANTGAFSGSGVSGGLNLGTGTGTLEGNILSALTLKDAGELIYLGRTQRPRPKAPPANANTTVTPGPLIYPGEAVPDFSAYPVFVFRLSQLDSALMRDREQLQAALNEASSPVVPAPPGPLGLPPAIVAGLAVTDLGKVLSYGVTSTQTLGSSVTFADTALAVAVSAAARRDNQLWQVSSQLDVTYALDPVLAMVRPLDQKIDEANGLVAQALIATALLNAEKMPTSFETQKIKDLQAGMTAVNADIAAYNTFLTGLTTVGPSSLLSITQSHVFEDIVKSHGILLVHVINAAGGVRADQRLGGVLGTSITVSGGIVAYYAYQYGLENAANVGDIVTSVTPYHTLGKVKDAIILDRKAQCFYEHSDSDSQKYCPFDPVPPPMPKMGR